MQVTAIFDWDGVIIDSHDQHERSWSMLAAEEGNTLPEGFFYDPEDTITGTWNDEVEQAIKIAVEKCGCNGAAGSRASLVLAAVVAAAAAWLA